MFPWNPAMTASVSIWPATHAHGIQLGLMTPEQPVDDEALANLIFLPGFSTAEKVTELAGRGVGMDVVRTDVMALGGRIKPPPLQEKARISRWCCP